MLAGLLLPFAVLGDRYGRKGLLLIGLTIFGAASGVAAFATTPLMLAVTRGAMGVGGACTMPATLSILGNVFDEHERGRAISIWSGVAGVASAAGPIAGGLLLARFWWGSIFLVNVPLARDHDRRRRRCSCRPRVIPNARPLDRGSALRWWGALTAALDRDHRRPAAGMDVAGRARRRGGRGGAARGVRAARAHVGPADDPAGDRTRPAAAVGRGHDGGAVLRRVRRAVRAHAVAAGPARTTRRSAPALFFLPNAFAGVIASLANPRWVARYGHGRGRRVRPRLHGAGRRGHRAQHRGVVGARGAPRGGARGLGIGTTAPSGAELIMSSASADNAGAAAGVNETIVEAAGALGVAVLGTVLAAQGLTSGTHYAWPMVVAAVVSLVRRGRRGAFARAPGRVPEHRSRPELSP